MTAVKNRSMNITIKHYFAFIVVLFSSLLLASCGGSSSTGSTGFYQFYNTSNNAPPIYMTIDDNTYSSVSFEKSTSYYEYDNGEQDVSLKWQDGDDSYQTIYDQTLTTTGDNVQLLMLTGDIASPEVINYQFAYENPDDTDAIFTLRFINATATSEALDVYISSDDETFNEATLIGSYTAQQMSDSEYFDYAQSYKFYITLNGSDEVLYTSDSIYFGYTSQYVMVIRANNGPGDSPYTMDKLSKSNSVVNYPDEQSGAEVKLYNAIQQNDLLANYTDSVTLQLTGLSQSVTVENLVKDSFTEVLALPFGDYSLDLTSPTTSASITKNKLVTLPANSDKTGFLYTSIVTEADDGNDSTVEETNAYINLLLVNNSNRVSYYDHQISLINLIDDYTGVHVYFVKSNETIANAYYNYYNTQANPATMTLLNNSYDVYVVAKEDNSDLILKATQLTLDENSGDLFMVMDEDVNSATGYKISFIKQND